MNYRNERLNKSFLSLEKMLEGYPDTSKASALSDRGKNAAAMVRALDDDADRGETAAERTREEKLWEAEMRLADAGKSHLIRVLLLIVENGSNREESAAKVSRRTYFRHRNELLEFFSVAL